MVNDLIQQAANLLRRSAPESCTDYEYEADLEAWFKKVGVPDVLQKIREELSRKFDGKYNIVFEDFNEKTTTHTAFLWGDNDEHQKRVIDAISIPNVKDNTLTFEIKWKYPHVLVTE